MATDAGRSRQQTWADHGNKRRPIAYILGPLLFGWYGLFLGPVLLVLAVHFGRLVLPELLHAERLQPYAVDPTYFMEQPEPDEPPAGSPDGELFEDTSMDVQDAPVDETME